MNADRLRGKFHFRTSVCDDHTALCDAESLPGRFGRIANDRVIEFARAQCAVRLVAAVGEGLGGDGKTRLTENLQHRRARKTHEYGKSAEPSDLFGFPFSAEGPGDSMRNGFGERATLYGL